MADFDFLKYSLRAYQKKSFEELLAKIRKYERPLLLVMPTGTGKTRTAMALFLELIHIKMIRNVVWIAHRYELLYSLAEISADFLLMSIYGISICKTM